MADRDGQVKVDITAEVSPSVKAAAAQTAGIMSDLKSTVAREAAGMVGASESVGIALAAMSASAIIAAGGIAVVVKAYMDGKAEVQAMNLAIAKTGDFAGQTRDSLRQLSADWSAHSRSTVGDARDLATALAASGVIGAEAFGKIGALAADYARVMGEDVAGVGPKLARLFDDPTKGAQELNKTLHFLSVTEMEQIRTLQAMGEEGQAQALLADRLKEKLDGVTSSLQKQTGLWQEVKRFASEAWDTLSSIGREQTRQERIRELEHKQSPGLGIFSGLSKTESTELANLKAAAAEEEAAAKRAAENAAQQARDIATWGEISKKSVSARAAEIDVEIARFQAFAPETIAQANAQAEAIRKLREERAKLFEQKPPKVERDRGIEDFAVVQAKQYASLYAAGAKYMESVDAQVAAGHRLTEGEKILAAAKAKLTDAQYKEIEAILAGAIEKDKAYQAEQEYIKNVQAYFGPIEEKARAAEKEIENYGLTEAQIQRTIVARLEEARAIAAANGALPEHLAFLDREIELRKRLAGAAADKDQLNQQADFWRSIEGTAHQTWTSITSAGKNMWTRLKETGKNVFFDWLYQMTLKKWIFNVVASVSGVGVAQAALGAQAASGAAGGGSGSVMNLLGLSDLPSVGTAISNVGSSWSTFTTLLSEGTGVIDAATAALSGMGGAFMTLLGVGGAIMAVARMFGGKGGGPKTEGDYFGTLGAGGTLTQQTMSTGGDGAWYTGGSGDATVKTLAEPIGKAIYDTIKSLGGDAAGLGVDIGFNTDPSGSAPDNVAAGLSDKNGRYVYRQTYDVGRGEAGKAMELEVQRLTLAAVRAADGIAPIFKAIVDGIDIAHASAEQLTAAWTHINDVKKVLDLANANPFADYATAAEQASSSLMTVWQRQAENLRTLAGAYDGSAAATATLAAATQSWYQAELQLAQQVAQVRQSSSAMFGESARNFQYQVLDNPGKYNFLDQEIDKYIKALEATTDPARINELAGKANTDLNAAFNLLSPEQQAALSKEYVARAEALDGLVKSRLDATEAAAAAERQGLKTDIVAAVTEAAEKMRLAAEAAAQAQSNAATDTSAAAWRLINAAAALAGGTEIAA